MVLGFWLTPRFTELHVGQKTSSGHNIDKTASRLTEQQIDLKMFQKYVSYPYTSKSHGLLKRGL